MIWRALLTFLLLSAWHGPARADLAPGAASAFVQDLGDRALASASRDDPASVAAFRTLIVDNFDLAGMGRTAGGPFLARASQANQADYQRAFADYMVRLCAAKLDRYVRASMSVEGETIAGDRALVRAQFTLLGIPMMTVDWRLNGAGGRLKVSDIEVDGKSLVQTRRSEFLAVMLQGDGGLPALLPFLRTQLLHGS